jgi:hypothetical protein
VLNAKDDAAILHNHRDVPFRIGRTLTNSAGIDGVGFSRLSEMEQS